MSVEKKPRKWKRPWLRASDEHEAASVGISSKLPYITVRKKASRKVLEHDTSTSKFDHLTDLEMGAQKNRSTPKAPRHYDDEESTWRW